jgi:hypothetical protein
MTLKLKIKYLLFLLTLFCLNQIQTISIKKLKTTPFSDIKRYTISGIISLPYAEINEPFKAWLDIDQYASRIDYYDGMVNTIQLAPTSNIDYGVGIKIAPMTGFANFYFVYNNPKIN